MAGTDDEITIAGFGGSFRKGSFNGMLLREAQRLMPPSSRLQIADISGIPLYNQDYENEDNIHITNFRNAIKNSAGFLVVTPEYNFSIPGFLKNAIDSVSRPPNLNPFPGKPGALMSASMSMLGGSRAQYHLRQVFTFLDARIINKPEVFISFANTKFDENGHLKDEMAIKFIRELLEKLVATAKANLTLKQ